MLTMLFVVLVLANCAAIRLTWRYPEVQVIDYRWLAAQERLRRQALLRNLDKLDREFERQTARIAQEHFVRDLGNSLTRYTPPDFDGRGLG